MANVKVFVHATDADADTRAMTLAPRTYLSRLAKKQYKLVLDMHVLEYKYTESTAFLKGWVGLF